LLNTEKSQNCREAGTESHGSPIAGDLYSVKNGESRVAEMSKPAFFAVEQPGRGVISRWGKIIDHM
jgi:hypothetical protein